MPDANRRDAAAAPRTDLIRRAEIQVPSVEFDADMQYFIDALGFRLDRIWPADAPALRGAFRTRDSDPPRAEHPARSGSATAPRRQSGRVRGRSGRADHSRGATGSPSRMRIRRSSSRRRPTSSWCGGSQTAMRGSSVEPACTTGTSFRIGSAAPSSRRTSGLPMRVPVDDMVHYHTVGFQLIFCHRGWVRLVYEDQGPPFVLGAGDCVIQPPGDPSPGPRVLGGVRGDRDRRARGTPHHHRPRNGAADAAVSVPTGSSRARSSSCTGRRRRRGGRGGFRDSRRGRRGLGKPPRASREFRSRVGFRESPSRQPGMTATSCSGSCARARCRSRWTGIPSAISLPVTPSCCRRTSPSACTRRPTIWKSWKWRCRRASRRILQVAPIRYDRQYVSETALTVSCTRCTASLRGSCSSSRPRRLLILCWRREIFSGY